MVTCQFIVSELSNELHKWLRSIDIFHHSVKLSSPASKTTKDYKRPPGSKSGVFVRPSLLLDEDHIPADLAFSSQGPKTYQTLKT